jgi:sec-independent protein translocase protein TatB
MFGAGWTEMLIIGVVALVVIGPKDLPVVMAKLGRMVRTVRRMGDEFRHELDKTTGFDQIADLRRSITEPLRQTSDEILREFNRQTETGVEPSGIVKPTDPQVESVYDQIAATSGLPPKSASSSTREAEPLPAPAEAAPGATKPRRPRRARAVAAEPAVGESKPKPRAARKAAAVAASQAEPAPAPPAAMPPAAPAKRAKPAAKRAAARKRATANGAAADPSAAPAADPAGAKDAASPVRAETSHFPAEEA